MTKKLFYPLFAFVVALSLAGVASAQGKSKTFDNAWIVDKACSANVVKGGESAADGHSGNGGCALKGKCAESGLGVYADGQYIAFNTKGTELAKAALEKSSKKTGAKFKVVGKVTGETMEVESITEVQ